jgi:hypothetical protein
MLCILYLIIAFIVSVLWFRYSIKDDLKAGVLYSYSRNERIGESILMGVFWIFVLLFGIGVGLIKLIEITAHVNPGVVENKPSEIPIEQIISSLLRYSFADVNYTFTRLTAKEKKIIGNSENFDKVIKWVENKRI